MQDENTGNDWSSQKQPGSIWPASISMSTVASPTERSVKQGTGLRTYRDAGCLAPNSIAKLNRQFLADLPALAKELDFDPETIPYVDFERIVVGWLLPPTPPT